MTSAAVSIIKTENLSEKVVDKAEKRSQLTKEECTQISFRRYGLCTVLLYLLCTIKSSMISRFWMYGLQYSIDVDKILLHFRGCNKCLL